MRSFSTVISTCVFGIAMFLGAWLSSPDCMGDEFTEVHVTLRNFDAAQHIHVKTPAQAESVRKSVIEYIWGSGGLPVEKLPVSVFSVFTGTESFPKELSGVQPGLVARVERLELNTDGLLTYAFLIHPKHAAETKRLAIVHHGHAANLTLGLDAVVNWFLQRGFDVLAMNMPLLGWNTDRTVTLPDGTSKTIENHSELMKAFGSQNDNGFRFFMDPVITGINYYAKQYPNYHDIVMTGLSGGGWTTHVVAAIDPRIRLSVPVAGSTPLYIRNVQPGSAGDLEQTWPGLYEKRASWLDLYILAGYGQGREQIQVLNQFDTCCFYGVEYTTYEKRVADTVDRLGLGKWRVVLDKTHKSHIVSPFVLKNVIAKAVELDERIEVERGGAPWCRLQPSHEIPICGAEEERPGRRFLLSPPRYRPFLGQVRSRR